MDGGAEIDALCRALNADFGETDGFQTAAGLVLNHLGQLPHEGDVFTLGGWTVEIIDMDQRRIDKLIFSKAS